MYILLLSLFAPLPYLSHLLPSSLSSTFASLPGLNITTAPSVTTESTILLDTSLVFPHHSFATYLASLLSLLIATFLGFMDDVFDIRWRFKLPIPGASLCFTSCSSPHKLTPRLPCAEQSSPRSPSSSLTRQVTASPTLSCPRSLVYESCWAQRARVVSFISVRTPPNSPNRDEADRCRPHRPALLPLHVDAVHLLHQ